MELGPELIARGADERGVPVLISLVSTALLLTPLLAFGTIAGQEIVHPLAVVVLGGLVTTAAVSLFALPVLYLHFAPRREALSLDVVIEHETLAIDLVIEDEKPIIPVGD
jgi:Cu/Ag efflux pump CusA